MPKRYIPHLVIMLLVLILLPVTVFLTYKEQRLGSKAAGCALEGQDCSLMPCCKNLLCTNYKVGSMGVRSKCIKAVGISPFPTRPPLWWRATPTPTPTPRSTLSPPPPTRPAMPTITPTPVPTGRWTFVGCYMSYPPCNCPPPENRTWVVCWYNPNINNYTCTSDYNHFCMPTPTRPQ